MRLMNFPMDGHACPLKFGSCELCVLRSVRLTDSCSFCSPSELLTRGDGLDVVKGPHKKPSTQSPLTTEGMGRQWLRRQSGLTSNQKVASSIPGSS